jgi:putative endonuclease
MLRDAQHHNFRGPPIFVRRQSCKERAHMRQHNYFVYLITNRRNGVLYTGVTNNILRRSMEHAADAAGPKKTFAGRYNCTQVVWVEWHQWIQQAIAREKEIKGWLRRKKIALIESENPEWRSLNDEL